MNRTTLGEGEGCNACCMECKVACVVCEPFLRLMRPMVDEESVPPKMGEGMWPLMTGKGFDATLFFYCCAMMHGAEHQDTDK